MKTFPQYRDDGSLHSFEITSMWISLRPIFRILRGVSGVTEVKRNWFSDDRILFNYHGIEGMVNEPWGDSSRYWIGLRTANDSVEPSIEPIHSAFQQYTQTPWVCLWQRGGNDS
jgi:hypothetical protein